MLLILALCSLISAITASNDVCNGVKGLCDLPINRVTFPGTHRSGAGANGLLYFMPLIPAVSCNHRYNGLSFTEQFRYGIRYFDVYPCYSVAPGMGRLKETGAWLCVHRAFGISVRQMIDELDAVLKRNPREFIIIHFNQPEDLSFSYLIFKDLSKHIEQRWLNNDPSEISVSDAYTKTGQYPTLREAIDTNKRVFIMYSEASVNQLKKCAKISLPPWMHSDAVLGRTLSPITVSLFGSCKDVVKATQRHCKSKKDTEFISLDVVASRGLCLEDMASKCFDYVTEASNACHGLRSPAGRTINMLVVSYPERDVEKLFIHECHRLNANNVIQWNNRVK